MKQSLLIAMCISAFIWTVVSVPGHVKKPCCMEYVKIPPIEKLKNYKIQKNDGRCEMKAVVFYTVKNKPFCGDPYNKQVKGLMKRLVKVGKP